MCKLQNHYIVIIHIAEFKTFLEPRNTPREYTTDMLVLLLDHQKLLCVVITFSHYPCTSWKYFYAIMVYTSLNQEILFNFTGEFHDNNHYNASYTTSLHVD